MSKIVALILLFSLTACALSTEVFRLRDEDTCRSSTVPDVPWLIIATCAGTTTDYVQLKGVVPDPTRMPPTAGVGFNVDFYFEVKQTFYAAAGNISVTWNGIPFISYNQEHDTLYESGVCYGMKEYAYLKTAPAGRYTAVMKIYNEFGSIVVCQNIDIQVRKATG